MKTMMDNKWKTGWLAIGVLAMGMGFASCGDDEDSISQEGSDKAGVVTGSDGQKKYLRSASPYIFNYDSSGKVTSVFDAEQNERYVFAYNPFTITCNQDVMSDIRVNNAGYITGFKYDVIEDDLERVTQRGNVSYDGNGHITKIEGSYSGTYTEDGQSYTEKGKGVISFTWSEGKLVKISNVSESEDGYKYVQELTYNYSGAYPNETKQYSTPLSLFGGYGGETSYLFSLGYFGVAGDYHPESLYVKETETEEPDRSDNVSFSYQLNSDGSLKSERVVSLEGSYTLADYTYITADELGTATTKSVVKNWNAKPAHKSHSFFKMRKQRR